MRKVLAIRCSKKLDRVTQENPRTHGVKLVVPIFREKPGKAIYQLIVEAQDTAKRGRRTESRHPFFRPVHVQVNGKLFSAFSRDISETGIGLQHNYELPLGPVQITIASEKGYSVRVSSRIAWCQPCGEGWYLSGGEFIAAPAVGD